MSTRCQIRFQDKNTIAQIYRHSDGYPDGEGGVISDLIEYAKAVEDNRMDDPSYAAANFIHWNKLQHEKGDPKYSPKFSSTGYGVEDPAKGIHGDESYLYVVEYPNIKVSHDFPNWGKDNAHAFEKAWWEFEGTLEEAYKKYVLTKKEEE